MSPDELKIGELTKIYQEKSLILTCVLSVTAVLAEFYVYVVGRVPVTRLLGTLKKRKVIHVHIHRVPSTWVLPVLIDIER